MQLIEASLTYEALTEAAEAIPQAGKAILVNWWEQIQPQDIGRIFGDDFPGWQAEHAGIAQTSLMGELRPDLVHTALKGQGGVPRMLSYDIFPSPGDVIPPTGVPWRSDRASPDIGRYLAGVLADRISGILDRESPPPADGVPGTPVSTAESEVAPGGS